MKKQTNKSKRKKSKTRKADYVPSAAEMKRILDKMFKTWKRSK